MPSAPSVLGSRGAFLTSRASGAAALSSVPALSVRRVSHRFGAVVALDDVSLEVPQGSFTVLLGPNGAGKSTLFQLATRLYDSVSGEISIFGHDVRRAPSKALARLGVVFQCRTLDLDLSLAQNLAYHASLHGLPTAQARERQASVLSVVGLSDKARDKVRALSGGQARRLEIARALLHEPGLLLLDEATVGLDIAAREQVLKTVRGLVAGRGLGVLWATHLIDEVEAGDHVVVLDRGRVRFSGDVAGLLAATGRANVREAFQALTRAPSEAAA